MRLWIVGLVALIVGCKGDTGPTGPQGPPGDNGAGVEWHTYYGDVPAATGSTGMTIPGLDMECPPVITVYFETTPGNWIQPNIADQYEENGEPAVRFEMVVIDDNEIALYSASAINSQRDTPFVIVIMSPVGYFEPEYDCP